MAQGRGYAVAHAANGHSPAGVAVAEEVVSSDPMDIIRQRLLQGDAVAEGRSQAQQLSRMAIASLECLPDSLNKQELVELAQMVVNRDH